MASKVPFIRNDIKEMLASTINLILTCKKTDQKIEQRDHRAILRAGWFGWMKYEFRSHLNIEKSCCAKEKQFEGEFRLWWFYFQSENAFREAFKKLK